MYRTLLLTYLNEGATRGVVKFKGDKNATEHNTFPEQNNGGSVRFT